MVRVAFISYDLDQGGGFHRIPPIHLCHLATHLDMNGFEVSIHDYSGPFAGMHALGRQLRDMKPDLVGLTCYTCHLDLFHAITRELRKYLPGAAMVLGGAHPSVWPEWTLENLPQFDYAMQGECDRSIVALAKMVSGQCPEADVPGLVYRTSHGVQKNERDNIDDLNDLPQVNRKYLDEYYKSGMYWSVTSRGVRDIMMTSRGCPHACAFCHKVERKYRFRTTEHLMVEFDELKSRGVTCIEIQDDAFTANRKRCFEVADNLSKGKYGFHLKVRSRVDAVDEEILAKLKEAGVREIVYGFESGSQKMLDGMNKRTTVAQNIRAIELAKKAGIGCYGSMIVGLPGETPETIEESVAFLLKYKPIVGGIHTVNPLPGTKLYEEAKRNGTLENDWSVDGPLPWVRLPWIKSRSELDALCTTINKRIHRDPGTILYFLSLHLGAMSWRQVRFYLRQARWLYLGR